MLRERALMSLVLDLGFRTPKTGTSIFRRNHFHFYRTKCLPFHFRVVSLAKFEFYANFRKFSSPSFFSTLRRFPVSHSSLLNSVIADKLVLSCTQSFKTGKLLSPLFFISIYWTSLSASSFNQFFKTLDVERSKTMKTEATTTNEVVEPQGLVFKPGQK